MTEVLKKKRRKSCPFTKEDELRLVEAIYAHKKIIENKKTNKVTNAEKEKAWERIRVAYNVNAIEYRNIDQLKSKYDNLKTKTRKRVAQEKAYIKGTGGGGPIYKSNDPVIDMILKIIDWKTVVELENIFDSDEIDLDNSSKENEGTDRVTDGNNHGNNSPIIYPFGEIVENETEEIIIVETEPMEIVPQASLEELTLTKYKLNTKLKDGEGSTPKKKSEKEKSQIRVWNSYTPRNLKEPVSRKLRPTIISPLALAKEDYYRKKALYLEAETKLREAQNRREEEEHKKKLLLLDIEIALKKEHLHKINDNK